MMMKLNRVIAILIAVVLCASGLFGQVDRIQRERMRDILNVVDNDVRKNFYDPELKKLDWKALVEQARQKIDKAQSLGEMLAAIYVLVYKLDDSHTNFYPPGRASKPIYGFAAKPVGDQVLVYAVKTKGAAAAAGIRVGDRIVSLAGYRVNRATWDTMMYDFYLLRPRWEMTVVYQRGNEAPQTVALKAEVRKDQISLNINTLIWRLIGEWGEETTYFCRTFDGRVGYMEVPFFAGDSMPQPGLFSLPLKAMVIDLRGNGGGTEKSLLELAGHFESGDTTMGNSIMRNKTEPLKVAMRKPNYADSKLVVLIDSDSASASEMLARHLQWSRKAIVIGDRSAAKVNRSRFYEEMIGTDRVVPFGAQVSVGRVVMADGSELEKRGVTPDVMCLPTGEELAAGRDTCLEKAMKIAYNSAGLGDALPEKVYQEIRGLVREMSADRQKRFDEASTKSADQME